MITVVDGHVVESQLAQVNCCSASRVDHRIRNDCNCRVDPVARFHRRRINSCVRHWSLSIVERDHNVKRTSFGASVHVKVTVLDIPVKD